MSWSLSPAPVFYEWVLELASGLVSALASASESQELSELLLVSLSVSTNRFRSLPDLKTAAPFLSRPAPTVRIQRREPKSLRTTSYSLIFRRADPPRRSTKPSFPPLARFALLNSSESILRSARDGRAQLA